MKALRILASPVCHLSHALHVYFPRVFNRKHINKRTVKCSLGGVVVLTGAYAAQHPVEFMPHFVWDAFSYALHGWGLVPILKVSAAIIDLEDV